MDKKSIQDADTLSRLMEHSSDHRGGGNICLRYSDGGGSDAADGLQIEEICGKDCKTPDRNKIAAGRNAYIDFLRSVFCFIICLYHWGCGHFGGGYLGVDFFSYCPDIF